MKSRTGALAAAAASLFVSGGVGLAAAPAHDADEIACEGVNECQSHSDCKTLFSECDGHDECAGKGFTMLTPEESEECEEARQAIAEEQAPGEQKERM